MIFSPCCILYVEMADKHRETIWFESLPTFMTPETVVRFFPVQGMTLDEQLNAVLRFAIYFAVILLIGGRSSRVMFIPLIVAGGTYFMHQAAKNDVNVMREGLTASRNSTSTPNVSKTKNCTLPTRHNPFMNVLPSDYASNPKRGPACDIQDFKVSKKVEKMFDTGLVRDSDDVFKRNAGSRQFMTNPSTTIPNDQSGFAQWLYGIKPVCKTSNRKSCMYST